MTELSDRKSAPAVTESLDGAALLGDDAQSKVKPATIWATVGGALLVVQLYVWIRWITGPGGICGDGTDQACPNPVLPMPKKRSGYVDTDGKLVLPDGKEFPPVVPFQQGN